MTIKTYYYFGLAVLCIWFAIDSVAERLPDQKLDSYIKGYETGVREQVQRSSER